MLFVLMMHGLHPLSLSFVFVLSNHPLCGREPKFYQGEGGYLDFNDQKALMMDLDSGTHYDLFKVYNPHHREDFLSLQLSFKEGVRSSFRVAVFDPSCWKDRECHNFGLMRFSIIILL